jgi:hypothetical protein
MSDEEHFVEIYHYDQSTHSPDSSGGLPAPSWPADYKLVATVVWHGPVYVSFKERLLDFALEEMEEADNFNVSWEEGGPARETGIGDVASLWGAIAYIKVRDGWQPVDWDNSSEPEPDGGGGGEEGMALTPEEIKRQMQAADDIRAMKEIEDWGKERGEMQDRVGKGVVSACDDIYRRVFEEGWYGRTIHDVIYERQLPDADKGKDAVDDEQREIENILKTMYGAGQGQGEVPQQGQDQGIGY